MKLGSSRVAADLLRAAEHVSFAGLGTDGRRAGRVSDELKREIEAEVDHLVRRAAEHAEEDGERYEEVVRLSEAMVTRARKGVARGLYRPALELARGAEALGHVVRSGSNGLQAGNSPDRLKR